MSAKETMTPLERDRLERQILRLGETRAAAQYWAKVIAGGLLLLVVAVFLIAGATAKYKVWAATQAKQVTITNAQAELNAAEFQKKIAVEEALAKKDSAPDLAAAEIIRAEGVAEANRIIADSITDEYVRWLYVDQLDEIDGQIIYIPTEGGIPILEANRLPTTEEDR